MMKKVLVLMLVLGLASAANAALSLTGKIPDGGTIAVGGTDVAYISSDDTLPYNCWVEIADNSIAVFESVAFTAGGNPNGDSTSGYWPSYGEWYDFSVKSLAPSNPLVAGNQVVLTILGVKEGQTVLNLYAEDSVTLLGSAPIVVPEPLTIALLGLGGLFLRRRK